MSDSAASVTRRSGSNLALSFVSLDPERRAAMSAFYAFCRVVDDIADAADLPPAEKLRQLDEWRRQIGLCYAGTPTLPLACELAPVVRRYPIPQDALLEIIAGVAMDAQPPHYETWDQLRMYCHRVASCVGLASIEIFGYRHASARRFAELLGLAFQTTNILRDVRQDLEIGRVYLPDEDFRRAGCSRQELERGLIDDRARHVFRLMAERSEHYYHAAARALHPEDRPAMRAAQVMRKVYYDVLCRIRAGGFDVWSRPTRLPAWRKAWLVGSAMFEERRHHPAPRPAAHVAVLGAGIAGLAAAVDLARRGHRVTVVDALPHAGGGAPPLRHPDTGEVIDDDRRVLLGCCGETTDFLDLTGSRPTLREIGCFDIPCVSETRGIVRPGANRWPGRLRLPAALLGCGELSLSERLRAVEPAIAALLDAKAARWRASTVSEWLLACRQPEHAVRALWEPFCIAALNEPVATGSAALFGEVIRRAFARGTAAPKAFLAPAGLGRLPVDRALDLIAACQGEVRLGLAVKSLAFGGPRVAAIEFDDGSTLRPDALIAALDWPALRPLLPPESALASQIAHLRGAPAIRVHLWFDREICDEPLLLFLDSPIQWIFNHNALGKREPGNGPSVTLAIRPTHPRLDAPSGDLAALALAECRRLLPAARDAQLRRHLVSTPPDATLPASPEMLPLRPGPATEWENLFLAGDWTDTGLPSGIEGAIASGRRAARLAAG